MARILRARTMALARGAGAPPVGAAEPAPVAPPAAEAAARASWDSPEYAEVKRLREGVGAVEAVTFEGTCPGHEEFPMMKLYGALASPCVARVVLAADGPHLEAWWRKVNEEALTASFVPEYGAAVEAFLARLRGG